MIKRVTLKFFKRFEDQSFDLLDNIVLAGPNNSGKSTLLQALAVWNLAIQKWRNEKGSDAHGSELVAASGPDSDGENDHGDSAAHENESESAEQTGGGRTSGKRSKPRPGVPITRKDFTAIPLRDLDLLWHNRNKSYRKDEGPHGTKPGTPKLIRIDVEGETEGQEWSLPFEFRYQSSELLYAIPAVQDPFTVVAKVSSAIQVVHVPPFSGIGSEETRHDRPYQDLLIGQGKPGDILRNLLLEVHSEDPEGWRELVRDIEELFGYQLLNPSYEGRPFIVCEYKSPTTGASKASPTRFDVASAGSGFHQVLMLLGFFYARKASVLLLDEPDAHQHVILQKQVYDRVREVARRRRCQLIVATHSEVLLGATSPDHVMSFYKKPHRLLSNTERDSVREALRRLSATDIFLAEGRTGILYTEGGSDLDLLREWARVLDHRSKEFLDRPLWHNNVGRHPREARGHHFALRAIDPKIKGILLLDGDNRNLDSHELDAEGLSILRWRRYEVENYLVVPSALKRFLEVTCGTLFSQVAIDRGIEYLRSELPPAVLEDPLGEHDYLNATAASKSILPGFFAAAGVPLSKNEYYQIASVMTENEIHDDVRQNLNQIASTLGL